MEITIYRVILGLYRDNGKENENYHLGLRVEGFGFGYLVRVEGLLLRGLNSGFSIELGYRVQGTKLGLRAWV